MLLAPEKKNLIFTLICGNFLLPPKTVKYFAAPFDTAFITLAHLGRPSHAAPL